jgi:hypothetical protein
VHCASLSGLTHAGDRGIQSALCRWRSDGACPVNTAPSTKQQAEDSTLLPWEGVARDEVSDALKGLAQVIQPTQFTPALVRKRTLQRVGVWVLHSDTSSEQDIDVRWHDTFLSKGQPGAQVECKQQLVSFEEGSANVDVEKEGEVVPQALKTCGDVLGPGCSVNGSKEERDEICQRVLVHRVDTGHVHHTEEQN